MAGTGGAVGIGGAGFPGFLTRLKIFFEVALIIEIKYCRDAFIKHL